MAPSQPSPDDEDRASDQSAVSRALSAPYVVATPSLCTCNDGTVSVAGSDEGELPAPAGSSPPSIALNINALFLEAPSNRLALRMSATCSTTPLLQVANLHASTGRHDEECIDVRCDRDTLFGNPFALRRQESLRFPTIRAHADFLQQVMGGVEPDMKATAVAHGLDPERHIAHDWPARYTQTGGAPAVQEAVSQVQQLTRMCSRHSVKLRFMCHCSPKDCHAANIMRWCQLQPTQVDPPSPAIPMAQAHPVVALPPGFHWYASYPGAVELGAASAAGPLFVATCSACRQARRSVPSAQRARVYCGGKQCKAPNRSPEARMRSAFPEATDHFAVEHQAFRSAYGAAASWSDFYNIHSQLCAAGLPCLYEIIPSSIDSPLHMFFDLETTKEDLRIPLATRVSAMREALAAFEPTLDPHRLLFCESDSEAKDSLHVIGGLAFKQGMPHLQEWGLRFKAFLEQSGQPLVWNRLAGQVDVSVWQSNRC